MTVLLIIPPSAFLIDERVIPSLGVLKVAAALEQQDVPVEVLDMSGAPDCFAIEQRVAEHAVIGVTATTAQMPAVTEIVAALRVRYPAARVILGGPHGTLMHAAKDTPRGARAVAVLVEMFDTVVVGDGEKAIFAALADDAPQIIDADDRRGQWWLSRGEYEESPWPARHLIDLKSYKYEIEGFQATSLIAQLGCPFHCGFCGGRNSASLRVVRTRSSANIIAEVRHIYSEYGYTGFMFYDDELNVNPKMVELMDGLSDLQDDLGVEFRLRGFVKAELFTQAQATSMRRAGFRWLLCGFEAADDRILLNMRKRATLLDNTRAAHWAHEAGLKVKALMSIGHPGETEESASRIRPWLRAIGADDFDCTVITPYPGTPYHDEAVDAGSGVWCYTQPDTGDKLYAREVDFSKHADYYKGRPGEYESLVWTDSLDAETIARLRDDIEDGTRKDLGLPSLIPSSFEHSMGQR